MKKTIRRTISLSLAAILLLALVPLYAQAESSGVTLMSLTRTTATAADAGNQFDADAGVFAVVSNLTAWNINEQITVGGTGRTPIVINNAAVTAGGIPVCKRNLKRV